MAADKNLFLYNLAVVSIMKNEAPYVKEWLDYHLLAGVEHFYIFDNESPDNLKEVLQPYIDEKIVTYHFYPGKARQYEAYNEAIQSYKFFCRYIAFIDADEFIFPQNNKSIIEVTDEILEDKPKAGGLAANIYYFGSNNLEKADYSKGVLERFTRRAPIDWIPLLSEKKFPGGTAHVSTITNPRRVSHFGNPHYAFYFEGFHAVNSNGDIVPLFFNNPPLVDKIVMNHYSVKSKEEYITKINRGTADNKNNIYNFERFKRDDHNEVFDDSILKYFANREKIPLETLNNKRKRAYNSLLKSLSPTFGKNPSKNIFEDKMETFLICLRLSTYLRENLFNETVGKFFEEVSLEAISKTLLTPVKPADLRLLFRELPNILKMNYPAVENIRQSCIKIIPAFRDRFKTPVAAGWKEFVDLQYLFEMLKVFEPNKN